MKPIREWLSLIKDDTIREDALRLLKENKNKNPENLVNSLHDAILEGFSWEGDWHRTHDKAKRGELELLSSPKEEFKVGKNNISFVGSNLEDNFEKWFENMEFKKNFIKPAAIDCSWFAFEELTIS